MAKRRALRADEIDPTQQPSVDLNRRSFVGIAAAAATAGVAPAIARGAALGGTHAPLVAENDHRIVVDRPMLHRASESIDAYAARPRDADASTPSVVVVMHVWGVDTSIRDVVRRLAVAGFAAIAPDLFVRFQAPSGDGVNDVDLFRPFAKRLERAQYSADIAAAQAWLHAAHNSTHTALLGFCMGGAMALKASIDDRDRFVAVCPFYGPLEGIDPKAVRMPVCGSYGARDTSIPADAVRAFAAHLDVPHDIRIYDEAGHAFFDDQRPRYVASAAADAWERTLRFLARYTSPAA